MDQYGWAEEEVPPPTDADAPLDYDDPSSDVEPWELTTAEQRIYEAGFTTAYLMRLAEIENLTREVADLNHEADRLYRAAFDHRNCACWKGHKSTTRESRA
jgi:hypothetical protein